MNKLESRAIDILIKLSEPIAVTGSEELRVPLDDVRYLAKACIAQSRALNQLVYQDGKGSYRAGIQAEADVSDIVGDLLT